MPSSLFRIFTGSDTGVRVARRTSSEQRRLAASFARVVVSRGPGLSSGANATRAAADAGSSASTAQAIAILPSRGISRREYPPIGEDAQHGDRVHEGPARARRWAPRLPAARGGWGWSNAGLITADGTSLLVDTLYDEQVKLIASAETEPDRLYDAPDGREIFEFRRTVSRLVEMRSEQYLALPHGHGRPSADTGGIAET